jgi:hypothetical protein
VIRFVHAAALWCCEVGWRLGVCSCCKVHLVVAVTAYTRDVPLAYGGWWLVVYELVLGGFVLKQQKVSQEELKLPRVTHLAACEVGGCGAAVWWCGRVGCA